QDAVRRHADRDRVIRRRPTGEHDVQRHSDRRSKRYDGKKPAGGRHECRGVVAGFRWLTTETIGAAKSRKGTASSGASVGQHALTHPSMRRAWIRHRRSLERVPQNVVEEIVVRLVLQVEVEAG